MSTVPMNCRRCGMKFTFPVSQAVFPCPACGALHERPQAQQEIFEGLDRANDLRADKDFSQALRGYEEVLRRCRTSHEALWGKVLCRYGVEYVEDHITHQRRPTLNFLQRTMILQEGDFLRACQHAPEEIAAQYREDALYIADVQKELLQSADAWADYDVFLCYKGSAPGGKGMAKEYEHAFKLYMHLEKLGFSVFFAHESLKKVAGARYEAGIFRALHSAKVMLVVCSDPANLTTAWVHSEWSRFLKRFYEGESCRLIPLLYDSCDAYSLPQELSCLQGIDMSDPDAFETLRENLKEYAQPGAGHAAEQHRDAVEDDALARIQYLLEAERWAEAEKSAENLMGERPRCSKAYLYKLLAAKRLMEPGQLGQMTTAFEDDLHWKKAMHWSKADERKTLEALLASSLEAREQKQIAEEKRRAEEARIAEEKRAAEEKRKAEEACRAEEERREEISKWHKLQEAYEAFAVAYTWNEAADLASSMILQRPKDYHGYLNKLLAKHRLLQAGALAGLDHPFEDELEWKRVMELAPEAEKTELNAYLKQSREFRKKQRAESIRRAELKRIEEQERAEKARKEEAQRQEEYWQALIRSAEANLKGKLWGMAAHSAQMMTDRRPLDYRGYLYTILAKHELSEPVKLAACPDAFEQCTEWSKLLDCAPRDEGNRLKEYLKLSLALRTAETERGKQEDHVRPSPPAPRFPDANGSIRSDWQPPPRANHHESANGTGAPAQASESPSNSHEMSSAGVKYQTGEFPRFQAEMRLKPDIREASEEEEPLDIEEEERHRQQRRKRRVKKKIAVFLVSAFCMYALVLLQVFLRTQSQLPLAMEASMLGVAAFAAAVGHLLIWIDTGREALEYDREKDRMTAIAASAVVLILPILVMAGMIAAAMVFAPNTVFGLCWWPYAALLLTILLAWGSWENSFEYFGVLMIWLALHIVCFILMSFFDLNWLHHCAKIIAYGGPLAAAMLAARRA